MSTPQYPYQPVPPPSGNSGLKQALVGGAIVASLAANGFLLYQVNDLKNETGHSREVMQAQIDSLKESSTVTSATQRKHLEDLREDLDSKAKQLSAAASQAKREAVTYADEKTKALESEQEKTVAQLGQVNSAVADVRTKADSTATKVDSVNGEVGAVKTDLAGTKTALDTTRTELQAQLKKVTGDLGITNGFVATNAKELDELRKRGERTYTEFTLKKQKNMVKVADISMRLDKSDPKKNKFTVVVLADDKNTEKKDRNINEPLQFYVAKSLYEVVVNSVGKDQISGYLSTPKYQASR